MIIRSKSQYYLYQSKKSSKSIFSNYFFNLLSKIKNHNSIFNYLGNFFVKNKYFYKKFYGDKIDKLISDFEMKKMKVSNLNVQDITKKILNFYND